MKRLLFLFLYSFIFILTFSGCNKKYTLPSSPDNLFKAGLDYYEKGKYGKARDMFQRFVFRYPDLPEAEISQFYIAETYLKEKKYQEALTEYNIYIQMYPGGKKFEEARFKKLICLYHLSPSFYRDQEKTLRAIKKIEEYIKSGGAFSDSAEVLLDSLKAKLSRKYYEAGLFYFRMKFYESAIIYADAVIEDYPVSPWYERALILKYRALKKEGKMNEADKVLDTMKALDSEEIRKFLSNI